MKKHIVLSDGTLLYLEPLTGREDPGEFQRFINTLTREKTYLLVNKTITRKEETQWLKTQIKEQRTGHQLYLKALVDGRLIGDCFARPGFGRNQGNVNLGIAIAQPWRGKGIGRLMLKELIEQSEKKWHPRNMYLHVVSVNTTAFRLYQSLGFRKIATLPEWFKYEKKYYDEYLLLLDKKYFVQQQKNTKNTTLSRY